jgi:hypothetical protein
VQARQNCHKITISFLSNCAPVAEVTECDKVIEQHYEDLAKMETVRRSQPARQTELTLPIPDAAYQASHGTGLPPPHEEELHETHH